MKILYLNENMQLCEISSNNGIWIIPVRNFIIGAIHENEFVGLSSNVDEVEMFTSKEVLAMIDRYDINLLENVDFMEEGRVLLDYELKICNVSTYSACNIFPFKAYLIVKIDSKDVHVNATVTAFQEVTLDEYIPALTPLKDYYIKTLDGFHYYRFDMWNEFYYDLDEICKLLVDSNGQKLSASYVFDGSSKIIEVELTPEPEPGPEPEPVMREVTLAIPLILIPEDVNDRDDGDIFVWNIEMTETIYQLKFGQYHAGWADGGYNKFTFDMPLITGKGYTIEVLFPLTEALGDFHAIDGPNEVVVSAG